MAKNTSKKIKELKGIKPEKVNDKELRNIQEVVASINQLHGQIGQLESQKHSALHNLAGVNDEMKVLQEKIKKDYGTNDINIADGKINYKEDGKADS